MLVTWLFTVECLAAMAVHFLVLRLRWQQRREAAKHRAKASAEELADAELMHKAANVFVDVEATRFVFNVLLVMVGLGIILHEPRVLYVLMVFPVLSVVGSWLLLRGIR